MDSIQGPCSASYSTQDAPPSPQWQRLVQPKVSAVLLFRNCSRVYFRPCHHQNCNLPEAQFYTSSFSTTSSSIVPALSLPLLNLPLIPPRPAVSSLILPSFHCPGSFDVLLAFLTQLLWSIIIITFLHGHLILLFISYVVYS